MKTDSASRLGKYAAAALLVLLAFLALPFSGKAEAPARNLTLMIYLCGSDLEGDHGSATAELEEIRLACAGNPQVSVLALAGGSRSWKGNYDPEELFLMEIGARGSRILQRFPSESMGKPEILSRLLQMGPELRPAAQYALILWDHGGGPLEGICFDDLYGRDSLTLRELQEALENSPFSGGNRLSWIGFDACLMSSVEVACACAPYADYMIASQETEPVSGWNYRFLSSVGEETGAEEIGRNIVDAYQDGKKETDMLTLALIRLDRMPALEAAVDAFFEQVGSKLTKDTFSDLSRCRLRAKGFGRVSTGSDYDLADIGNLVEQIGLSAPEEARALQSALSEAVLTVTGNQPHASGLSIYSPYYNAKMFSEKWQLDYDQLEVLTSYNRYLNRYNSFWSGAQMADWSHLTGQAAPPEPDGSQIVELILNEDQVDQFATASCMILEDYGSETVYRNTYVLEDLQADGNTLRTEYSFEALYAVDENGVVETDPIPFSYLDGYYLVYAVLQSASSLSANDSEQIERQPVVLQCMKNEEDQTLEIVNINATGEEGDLNTGRQTVTLDPEKWPFVWFLGIPKSICHDENGSLLPFNQWELYRGLNISLEARDLNGNTIPFLEMREYYNNSAVLPDGFHYVEEADNRRPWKLQFLPRKSTGKNLMAQFIIRDTQGNRWGSELIPLSSPDIKGTAAVNCERISYGDYSIETVEAKAILNESFQGICLRIAAENRGSHDLYMGYFCPIINSVSIPRSMSRATKNLASGEKGFFDLLIPIDDASLVDDPVLRSVSFLPFLIPGGDTPIIYLDRLYAETALDLSSFTFREPDRDYLAESIKEDIRFRLIFLRETENGLQGRLWMKNESPCGKRMNTAVCGDDAKASFFVNGLLMRNCLTLPPLIDLLPGGECTFDLRIVPRSDGTLIVGEEKSEGSPEKLVQIAGCGYRAFFSDGIGRVEKTEGDSSYAYFRLPQPIFLNKKIPLVYSINISLEPGDSDIENEKPAYSPDSLPDEVFEDELDIPESAAEPIPFFHDLVNMPLSPEQYAVTLTCPVSSEELESITKASVLLIFQRAFTGEYDLQALVTNVPRLEGNTVVMDFCGLLPSLDYSKQFFPCIIEEGEEGANIDLMTEILIAGIRGASPGERNQMITRAHLLVNVREGTARFTDYQVKPFWPTVQYEETVVFYPYTFTFESQDDGKLELRHVDDQEARSPEGHQYSGAPKIRMRPAQELKPDVLFRITHQDGSVTLTSLSWDQAVSRSTDLAQ